MGVIGRRVVVIIGGLFRWALYYRRKRKPLKSYFENEDGTEDLRQRKLNFMLGAFIVLIFAALVTFFFTPSLP